MRRSLPPIAGALAGPLVLVLAAPGPGAEVPPQVRPGTVVRWAGEAVEWCGVGERRFEPLDGACYYPVDLLQRAGPLELARGRGGRRETTTVRVGRFDYPVQKLTLPRRMVELSPEDLERVERENREMARLWTREGPRRFALPLAAPLDPLPAGGRFGHRRVINGRTRSPHGGADYTAAAGVPVLAAADGTVALVADQFFGGHAVFVDHGDGLVTMYMHMSRVDVAEGQPVRRGERVGAVGSTGRATGPHLHFGVRWRGARVDPALLLGDPGAIPAVG
ncbi:MAG TPA: M23 family metallopeptidase [Vicinamibacteria bacterium]|nr:M23 family metallopeptidase [Vicinamibacteria bacterium]